MALTPEQMEKVVDGLIMAMAQEGYATDGGNDLDQQVAEENPCTKCNSAGAEYYAFVSNDYHSRRAFAICRNCGHLSEF
jgi:hypothetical protein